MQFDLFECSRDTGMRNDVLNALEQFDAMAAQAALAELLAAFPQDASSPDLRSLIDALALRNQPAFASHHAVAEAREQMGQVEAGALRMFGKPGGRQWLAALWCDLALRAAALPFSASESENHSAALYLHAANWQAAGDAVAKIASWRRIPAPLGWMAQAQYRLHGREAAWPFLCELAWMVPARFDALSRRLADPVINALLKQFHAGFDGAGDVSDLAWFPAWALVEDASLASWLHDMQPSRDGLPERAAQTLLELLALEKRGQQQAVLERRKRLQGLQPSLYDAYMKKR